jgi:hypothetical protein
MEGHDHQFVGRGARVFLDLARERRYRECLFRKLISISLAHTREASARIWFGRGQ